MWRYHPLTWAGREWPISAQPDPSPRDPRKSAIHTRSGHSPYTGRTVGYGQTEKGPASLHLAADEPRTAEMHTDLVHSAGECSSRHSFDCSRFITVISGTWWVVPGPNSIPRPRCRCRQAALSCTLASKSITMAPRMAIPCSRSSGKAPPRRPLPSKNRRCSKSSRSHRQSAKAARVGGKMTNKRP